ncbi:MAG: M48 family metalloprotease [Pseudomonadaceae bacterium]|nr:M48 family metalloprotease [Pseudomonadaceae bacterium]
MSETVSQFCIQCGVNLPEDSRFCTECGHEVGTPPPVAEVTYAPHPAFGCSTCAGDGSRLHPSLIYCPECRWLRPLTDDYFLEMDAFMWQMDAQAMGVLNGLGPLSSAAHNIAERYGRPVFEAATNGIRLSERQMPEIFNLALYAARLTSLTHMPEVYISGERMWDVYSLGGYSGSFVSIGSVLINFKPKDLLFLIAREMGHVRAGHVYWNTAMQFLLGQSRGQTTILGQGVLQFLNPAKLVESAIEAPLMRWARHAEITADRAATLVTGDLATARQVLTQWSMKSFPVYGKVNLDAWLEQEAASDDPYLRMSEWTMSTTPYLAPRLRILAEYAQDDGFAEWRRYITHWADPHSPIEKPEINPRAKPKDDRERMTCAACGAKMSVPKEALTSGKPVNVRCPNTDCRKVLRVKPKTKPTTPPSVDNKLDAKQAAAAKVRLSCVSCNEAMYVDKQALQSGEAVNVRCPNPACGEVLSIKPKPKSNPQRPDLMAD